MGQRLKRNMWKYKSHKRAACRFYTEPLCCCWLAQSCPTLCDPTDCSPPDSSVHGILQAGILEWVAVPSSRGSSQLGDRTCVSCIGRWILYHWATRKPNSFPQLMRKLLSKIRLLRPLTWKGQTTPESTLSFYNEKTEALGTSITYSRSSNH